MKVNLVDKNLREKMALLNEEVRYHKNRQPLANHQVLLIQHQLQDSFAQVSALIELGLNPKELFWIDIPYTSFPEVRSAVQYLGVPEKNLWSHGYNLTIPYRSYQITRVHQWIREIASQFDQARKLIVIDDGAYFVEASSTIGWKFPSIAVVEQSQSGIRFIRTNTMIRDHIRQLPIINVAESKPKKVLEAPIIVRAVDEALTESIGKRLDVSESRDNCLVLGYGSIGSIVASTIPQHLGFSKKRTCIYDPLIERRNMAQADGYPLWNLSKSNNPFKLVLGCSGDQSFTLNHRHNLQDGAFIASASTGSIELSIEKYLETANTKRYPDIEFAKIKDLAQVSIHTDLEFYFDNRKATFLNGGFPINFDGRRIDRIAPEDIQLTAALMVRGAVQAATTTERGIIGLDEQFCERITKGFQMRSASVPS